MNRPSQSISRLHPWLRPHLDEIRRLCDRYDVSELAFFGSATRSDFDPQRSDIDCVVTFASHAPRGGFSDRYFKLRESMSALLGREVDLVERKAIRNRFFHDELAATQVEAYAA